MVTTLQDALSTLPDCPVYHYTSGIGLLGIIQSRTIRATNILYLNDATELGSAKLASEQVRELRETCAQADIEFLDEVEKRLSRILEFKGDSVYVCSFSEVDDDLSQWRGYCPDGNGFSIGFDLSLIVSQIANFPNHPRFRAYKCVYDPDGHRKIVEGLLDESIKTFHKTQAARPGSDVASLLAAMNFEIEFELI